MSLQQGGLMKLEAHIIRQYKKLFPHETLRVTAEKTGIQVTRVFRLMNGRKMRVSELEAFQKVIDQKTGISKNSSRIQKLTEELMLFLDEDEFSFVLDYLERRLGNRKYSDELIANSILLNQIA